MFRFQLADFASSVPPLSKFTVIRSCCQYSNSLVPHYHNLHSSVPPLSTFTLLRTFVPKLSLTRSPLSNFALLRSFDVKIYTPLPEVKIYTPTFPVFKLYTRPLTAVKIYAPKAKQSCGHTL